MSGLIRNFWLSAAGISGALAVGLGAFGAHGLKDRVTDQGLQWWNTGASYHLIHSVALLGVGILANQFKENSIVLKRVGFAGIFFAIGIALFSGSLYTMALTEQKALGMITPIGGTFFILGWLYLLFL